MKKTFLMHLAAVGLLGATITHAASSTEPFTAVYVLESKTSEAEHARSLQWQLTRGEGCVEVSDHQAKVTERWDRDDHGRIWYKRVFHNEKKAIEYQPTDLALGGVESEWARISQIIDPRDLQQLSVKPGNEKFEGQPVLVYEGTRQGARMQVRWLTATGIPERVVLEGDIGSSSLQLLHIERHEPSNAACRPLALDDYDQIDFADIGDRHDPFLERLMKYEGFAHGHQ